MVRLIEVICDFKGEEIDPQTQATEVGYRVYSDDVVHKAHDYDLDDSVLHLCSSCIPPGPTDHGGTCDYCNENDSLVRLWTKRRNWTSCIECSPWQFADKNN